MMTVTLNDQIERQLTKIAREQTATPDELVEKAIRTYLQAEASQVLERETVAFRALHAELLAKYPGEYVAIHQGQVIDHDPKLLAIYLRIDEKYPDEIILIKQVQSEIERVFTVRSPRLVHEDYHE
jgi:predicted transcriptional regulator